MTNKQIIIESKNGNIETTMRSNLTFPTLDATNKLTPNGGVMKPIAKLATKITPKWTGSTPTVTTIGSKIGVKTTSAEMVSINIPTTKSSKFIASNMTIGLLEKSIRNPAI